MSHVCVVQSRRPFSRMLNSLVHCVSDLPSRGWPVLGHVQLRITPPVALLFWLTATWGASPLYSMAAAGYPRRRVRVVWLHPCLAHSP